MTAKKLTDKQSKFIKEYAVDLNATQAAIRAGYSEDTAQQMGSENLSKPVIADAIAKQQAKHAERCDVTIDSLTDELNEAIAMSRSQEDPNALRAAVMSKAKIHGLDINKFDGTVKGEVTLIGLMAEIDGTGRGLKDD